MAQSKKPAIRRGHPDPLIRKLHKTTEAAVELVRDLQGRMTEEQWLELRAGVCGLLITDALFSNMPDPRELTPVPGHTPPERKETP
jgi:hypothetical protein